MAADFSQWKMFLSYFQYYTILQCTMSRVYCETGGEGECDGREGRGMDRVEEEGEREERRKERGVREKLEDMRVGEMNGREGRRREG